MTCSSEFCPHSTMFTRLVQSICNQHFGAGEPTITMVIVALAVIDVTTSARLSRRSGNWCFNDRTWWCIHCTKWHILCTNVGLEKPFPLQLTRTCRTVYSDVWVYSLSLSAWSLQPRPTTTIPSGRAGHSALYLDKMFIFGGKRCSAYLHNTIHNSEQDTRL